MAHINRFIAGATLSAVCCIAACSSSDDPNDNTTGQTGGAPGATGGVVGSGGVAATGGVTPSSGGVVSATGGTSGAGGGPAAGGAASGGFPPASGGAPGSGGAAPATGGVAGSGGASQPAGPENGDPTKPVITATGVACSNNPPALAGTNVKIGGRDVFVSYPCEKHQGAPATFILNLHGTMATENLKMYGTGYFAAHTFGASHNLIVAAPKAIGSQWGRSDNGADEPHLMEVIDWVYKNLSGFDIREMWVAGHSWGGGYAGTFGCKPELQSKVKGVVLMSGGAAACASRISVIISMAEGDGRQPADQSAVATGHGCDAAKVEKILTNDHTSWPNCDPGFVHANYYMLGKEHATFMDRDVVKSIVDWIKLGRR